MKRLMIIFLALTLTVLGGSAAWGGDAGLGARAIGMGGAYTAIADDGYAPYWNPAGITQVKHVDLSLGLGLQGDFDKLDDISERIDDERMPDREDLNQNYFFTGLMGIVTKRFALSGSTDNRFDTIVDAAGNVSADFLSASYGAVTVAAKITENWTIGVNLKCVAAGYGVINFPAFPDYDTYDTDEAYLADAINYSASTSYATGTGTALDAGALYCWSPKITFGFTARNIFYDIDADEGTTTTYKMDYSDPENPELAEPVETPYKNSVDIPQSYVFGVAYRPYEKTLVAADLEAITNSLDDQTRLHVGVEQSVLRDTIALRAGLFTNDGESPAFTLGAGLKVWVFETNFAFVKTDGGEEYVFTAEMKF